MSRSIKKGPYVAPERLKRVEEMNAKGEKNVLKTWSRSSTCLLYTSQVQVRGSGAEMGLSLGRGLSRLAH